jgi:hypothetical protein
MYLLHNHNNHKYIYIYIYILTDTFLTWRDF